MKKLPCALMAVPLLLCTASAALAEDLRSSLYTYTVDRPEPVKIADFNINGISGMQMESSDVMYLGEGIPYIGGMADGVVNVTFWMPLEGSHGDLVLRRRLIDCNNFIFPLDSARTIVIV